MLIAPSALYRCHRICDASFDLGDGHKVKHAKGDWLDEYALYRASAQGRQAALSDSMDGLDYKTHFESFDIDQDVRWGAGYHRHRSRGTNLHWRPRGVTEPPRYLVCSHSDHIAGLGAVDNVSGMGVMAKVAQILRGRRDVIYACFDAEELGCKGSRAFMSLYRYHVQNVRQFLNIDSVGEGTLVNFPPEFHTSTASGLPVVSLREHSNDGESFLQYTSAPITTVCTVSGIQVSADPNVKTVIPVGDVQKVSVANQRSDQRDKLSGETLEQAVEFTVRTILDDAAGTMRELHRHALTVREILTPQSVRGSSPQ